MTNYREDFLNNTLLMLDEAGIKEIDTIKNILVQSIANYEITERCTELAVIDNGNIKAIKMFLATKKIEGGSTKTTKNRLCVLRMFNNDIAKPFEEIDTLDILYWLSNIQNRVRLNTAKSYSGILTAFFTWMHKTGVIEKNPMENIQAIKYIDPIKKPFTSIEIDSMRFACRKKLDRAMIELFLTSGIRCEELCNLKWEDINFSTKDVAIIEGKGGKNRITMMDDVTRKYLLEYRESLEFDSEYVFAVKYGGQIKQRSTGSVWTKLKSIEKRANIENVHPHRFRYTFATNLYKRGMDVHMIQRLLGHSNINTTMMYIKDDLDLLRNAYDKCAA